MGLEVILPYIVPILAANVKGVASWFGSKWGKGEAFDLRKVIRTAVSGLVTMLIAYGLGWEPTDANLVKVATEYGFAVAFFDTLFMKYAWKKLGLMAS